MCSGRRLSQLFVTAPVALATGWAQPVAWLLNTCVYFGASAPVTQQPSFTHSEDGVRLRPPTMCCLSTSPGLAVQTQPNDWYHLEPVSQVLVNLNT